MTRRPAQILDTAWKQASKSSFLSLAKPASFVPEIVSGVAQFCFERAAITDGILSKYPTAEPGALIWEPLKAADPGKHFELKFAPYMRNFSLDVGHWIRRKQSQHLGFISADFSLQSRFHAKDKIIGPYGQGGVYQDVLDELRNRTFTLRSRYKLKSPSFCSRS
jgi:hypothetical protein